MCSGACRILISFFRLSLSLPQERERYKENWWDPKQLIGSGGMPSSHSVTVTALAVGVGLQEGFGGSEFATALVLACVVMYDATGVRLHAGRQAEVLNQILFELPAEHPRAESTPLRELLGQTPTQVAAGALLGLLYLYHSSSVMIKTLSILNSSGRSYRGGDLLSHSMSHSQGCLSNLVRSYLSGTCSGT